MEKESMPPLARLEDLIPLFGIFRSDERWSKRSRLRTQSMKSDPNYNFFDIKYFALATRDASYFFAVNMIQMGYAAGVYFIARELFK